MCKKSVANHPERVDGVPFRAHVKQVVDYKLLRFRPAHSSAHLVRCFVARVPSLYINCIFAATKLIVLCGASFRGQSNNNNCTLLWHGSTAISDII